ALSRPFRVPGVHPCATRLPILNIWVPHSRFRQTRCRSAFRLGNIERFRDRQSAPSDAIPAAPFTRYAHFENKEKFYLAVIELVRGLLLTKLASRHRRVPFAPPLPAMSSSKDEVPHPPPRGRTPGSGLLSLLRRSGQGLLARRQQNGNLHHRRHCHLGCQDHHRLLHLSPRAGAHIG